MLTVPRGRSGPTTVALAGDGAVRQHTPEWLCIVRKGELIKIPLKNIGRALAGGRPPVQQTRSRPQRVPQQAPPCDPATSSSPRSPAVSPVSVFHPQPPRRPATQPSGRAPMAIHVVGLSPPTAPLDTPPHEDSPSCESLTLPPPSPAPPPQTAPRAERSTTRTRVFRIRIGADDGTNARSPSQTSARNIKLPHKADAASKAIVIPTTPGDNQGHSTPVREEAAMTKGEAQDSGQKESVASTPQKEDQGKEGIPVKSGQRGRKGVLPAHTVTLDPPESNWILPSVSLTPLGQQQDTPPTRGNVVPPPQRTCTPPPEAPRTICIPSTASSLRREESILEAITICAVRTSSQKLSGEGLRREESTIPAHSEDGKMRTDERGSSTPHSVESEADVHVVAVQPADSATVLLPPVVDAAPEIRKSDPDHGTDQNDLLPDVANAKERTEDTPLPDVAKRESAVQEADPPPTLEVEVPCGDLLTEDSIPHLGDTVNVLEDQPVAPDGSKRGSGPQTPSDKTRRRTLPTGKKGSRLGMMSKAGSAQRVDRKPKLSFRNQRNSDQDDNSVLLSTLSSISSGRVKRYSIVDTQINFIRARDWKKRATVGFSKGSTVVVKPLPRKLWHDIDEGAVAKELVSYSSKADPVTESPEWMSFKKERQQGPFHAVVCVVDRYTDASIPDIPVAAKDREELVDALTTAGYTLDVLQTDEARPFLTPTRENLLRVLDLAKTNVKKTEGVGEEKEEFLTERSPGVMVILVGRGCLGSLTFLNTGHTTSRILFTREASSNYDRSNAGIVPLASLMQEKDALGRKLLIICDLWPLRGGIANLKGQAGLGFAGGFESVGGEIDATYPPNVSGGVMTYYVIKALRGKAGRASTISTCTLNAYVMDRLLKNRIAVQTDASHLTYGNRIIIDRDPVAELRRQWRYMTAVGRWAPRLFVVRAEIPLGSGASRGANEDTVRFRTLLMRELYRLLYRSNHVPAKEPNLRPIRLGAVTDTPYVVLHFDRPILNSAEGVSVWTEAINTWCFDTASSKEITEVALQRCAQRVVVRCASARAMAVIKATVESKKPLLGRLVKHATLLADLTFQGCVRDTWKMSKALRLNMLSKLGVELVDINPIPQADELEHHAAMAVQRLWRGVSARRRIAIVLALEKEQREDFAASVAEPEQEDLAAIFEWKTTHRQRIHINAEAEARFNLIEWEHEDRVSISHSFFINWQKTALAMPDATRRMKLLSDLSRKTEAEAKEAALLSATVSRTYIVVAEDLGRKLLEVRFEKLSIMHEESVSGAFLRTEPLQRMQIWGRFHVAQEEYSARLALQRQADVMAGVPVKGMRVEKEYRPNWPVSTSYDARWGELAELEQLEGEARRGVEGEELQYRSDVYEGSQWLRNELVRLAKVQRMRERVEEAKRDNYMKELQNELEAEEWARQRERELAEAHMRRVAAKAEEEEMQEHHEKMKRKNLAVHKVLDSSSRRSSMQIEPSALEAIESAKRNVRH